MAIDREKLLDLLAGLRAGGSDAADLYGAYLDRLPTLFGSQKLADEADLILAALTAAEQAYAKAVAAEAPIAFEPAGENAEGAPLFRPTASAPVGGLPADWMGVPLHALATALGRARERVSADDEVYSAAFVYVLFRLKAALGVWRGDASPDARYRLWLKDLGPVIAEHPRLGPKVVACHGRIARAVLEECETYLPALRSEAPPEPPPVFAAFAVTGLHHAVAAGLGAAELGQLAETLAAALTDAQRRGQSGWQVALTSALICGRADSGIWLFPSCNDLASAYTNRGNAKQNAEGHGPGAAIGDYDLAIAIREALRLALEPRGQWDPPLRNDLASAYTNRGAAKQSAEGHGPGAAIGDYDLAIAIREALRQALEPRGQWDPPLRHDLASAYMNRGTAKLSAEGHGPGAAISDYDLAIAIMEALRLALEPRGQWDPKLRNDLASAYMNRGNAKQSAEGHGPGAAIGDYDLAIAIMEALRLALEPRGQWDPPLRHDLASAYTNRGNAKQNAEGHGPGAAIGDYDLAIAIMEALRLALEPRGQWDPKLRNDLANAYMNRGNAKLSAEGHGPGAAIGDYDLAIAIREALRLALEPRGQWDPPLRHDLASAYTNRGNAKQNAEGHGPGAAIGDYDLAIAIMEALRLALEPRGQWDPPLRNDLAGAYMNRGNAKQSAEGHGPGAAIGDYDLAIAIMEALRLALEPRGQWDPPLRNDLASAYTNRGAAKQSAEGHGPGAAIGDYDLAIAIREALRLALEPRGQWDPPLRNDLASAYMNRGAAKLSAEGHGPGAAVSDYDLAIAIREALRQALEPRGQWDPPLRHDLASAYMNRGTAKLSAEGHGPGAAISDYDLAIAIMEALRLALEPRGQWNPPLRNDLAIAHVNRAIAKADIGDHAGACVDARRAQDVADALIDQYGAINPLWRRVADVAAAVAERACNTGAPPSG